MIIIVQKVSIAQKHSSAMSDDDDNGNQDDDKIKSKSGKKV